MKAKLVLVCLIVFSFLLLGAGEEKKKQAERLTGQVVLTKVKENFERGVTTVVEEFSMEWIDKRDRSIDRELIRREKKYREGDKISLEVTRGRGEGIKVLIHEVPDGTNLQWILVGRRVRQVDASDKSQRFLNGPTHEDLEFWHCKDFRDFDFNTQAVREVELDGRPCYLVRAVPRRAELSEYSSLEIWIERGEEGEVLFTRQIKYYKRSEREEREDYHKKLVIHSFARDRDTGALRPDHLELIEEAGYRTVFRTSQRRLNVRLEDTYFSRRWLDR